MSKAIKKYLTNILDSKRIWDDNYCKIKLLIAGFFGMIYGIMKD